jgi:hypothetical protein
MSDYFSIGAAGSGNFATHQLRDQILDCDINVRHVHLELAECILGKSYIDQWFAEIL